MRAGASGQHAQRPAPASHPWPPRSFVPWRGTATHTLTQPANAQFPPGWGWEPAIPHEPQPSPEKQLGSGCPRRQRGAGGGEAAAHALTSVPTVIAQGPGSPRLSSSDSWHSADGAHLLAGVGGRRGHSGKGSSDPTNAAAQAGGSPPGLCRPITHRGALTVPSPAHGAAQETAWAQTAPNGGRTGPHLLGARGPTAPPWGGALSGRPWRQQAASDVTTRATCL